MHRRRDPGTSTLHCTPLSASFSLDIAFVRLRCLSLCPWNLAARCSVLELFIYVYLYAIYHGLGRGFSHVLVSVVTLVCHAASRESERAATASARSRETDTTPVRVCTEYVQSMYRVQSMFSVLSLSPRTASRPYSTVYLATIFSCVALCHSGLYDEARLKADSPLFSRPSLCSGRSMGSRGRRAEAEGSRLKLNLSCLTLHRI